MNTAIVSHNWSTIKCKSFLEDKKLYSTYKVFPTQQELNVFNSTINTRISNRLGNIKPKFRLLAPNNDSFFPNFYVLSKVHKNPIRAQPITGAFNGPTTKISKVILDILIQVHKNLLETTKERGFEDHITICIQTEDAIRKLNTAFDNARISLTNTGSSVTPRESLMLPRYTDEVEFTSFDFESMYNNLDVKSCIQAINLLVEHYCNFSPNHKFCIDLDILEKSDYNVNI
jgi:hypothetical protein